MRRIFTVAPIALVLAMAAVASRSASAPSAAPASITFEPVQRLMLLRAHVNGSRPLSFALDTGNRYAIIDLALAEEIGLPLGDGLPIHGAGGSITGRFVRDAKVSVDGLEHFSQPVALAMSLQNFAPRMGHDLDGVLGSEFIKQFVVEIDSRASQIRLHDRNAFVYNGPGRSVPVRLDASGHPILDAVVTPVGGKPIDVKLVVDTGASGALDLRAPFVAKHGLPGPNVRTVVQIDGAGAGGETAGVVGRIETLQFGGFSLRRPTTVFSKDRAGSNATDETQGKIGARILNRFKLFLDYGHDRIIFEPYEGALKQPFDIAVSGVRFEATPPAYRSFQVADILQYSAAQAAGLRPGDMLLGIDGRPASSFTLTQIAEMFERVETHRLQLQRGTDLVEVSLTPRREI